MRPTKAFGRDPRLQFEYHLARELKMTHGELQIRMSGDETAHWIAYFQRQQRDAEAEQRKQERMAAMQGGRSVTRL